MNLCDRFGVSEEQLRALVAEGLQAGGDWCDLYFEDTSYHDLLLRDGVVGSGGYHVDYGCGIRVLKGEKTGYAYAETTDYPSLLQAAKAAGSIASAAGGGTPGPQNFASLIPPTASQRVPPVHEATGGHGFSDLNTSPRAATTAVVWWGQNWRKGGLQERRNEVIREQGFYNQTWCGCEFSRNINP